MRIIRELMRFDTSKEEVVDFEKKRIVGIKETVGCASSEGGEDVKNLGCFHCYYEFTLLKG